MKNVDLIKNFYFCHNYIKSLNTMWKAFFGAIFGLFVFLIILLAFHKPLVNRYFLDISQENPTSNVSNNLFTNNISPDSVTAMRTQIPNIDERFNSINKRFDDFFIMAGIIITLLLAINVGIYVNTDSKVDKYFTDHYEEYASKVRKITEETETLYTEFKSKMDLKMREIEKMGKDQEVRG
jgi:hypothetical protein